MLELLCERQVERACRPTKGRIGNTKFGYYFSMRYYFSLLVLSGGDTWADAFQVTQEVMDPKSNIISITVIAGCFSIAHAYQVGTLAAISPMTADKQYPQLSEEIKYTRLFAPSLGAYVDDPETACTIIAPDNDVSAPRSRVEM